MSERKIISVISYGGVTIPVKRLCVADLMIAAEPGSGSPIQDHSGSSELELFSTENFDGSGLSLIHI